MGIICDNCGKENFCGCNACKSRRESNKNLLFWVWDKEGNFELCGNCKTLLPEEETDN